MEVLKTVLTAKRVLPRRTSASHPRYLVRKMTKVGQQARKQGAFFSDTLTHSISNCESQYIFGPFILGKKVG